MSYRPITRTNVSWQADGIRIHGWFIRWDGDYAVCRTHAGQRYIHKSNLTYEAQ